MASPVLNDKAFERVRDESAPGWAAPDTVTAGQAPPRPAVGTRSMTANGTFARAFVLFVLVLAGRWSRGDDRLTAGQGLWWSAAEAGPALVPQAGQGGDSPALAWVELRPVI